MPAMKYLALIGEETPKFARTSGYKESVVPGLEQQQNAVAPEPAARVQSDKSGTLSATSSVPSPELKRRDPLEANAIFTELPQEFDTGIPNFPKIRYFKQDRGEQGVYARVLPTREWKGVWVRPNGLFEIKSQSSDGDWAARFWWDGEKFGTIKPASKARVRKSPDPDRPIEGSVSPRELRLARKKAGNYQRERALGSLDEEGAKEKDRMLKVHGERVRRMRSDEGRRKEKSQETAGDKISDSERIRRINILLRAGAYDRNRLRRLPEMVTVNLTRTQGESEAVTIPRDGEKGSYSIKGLYESLLPHEQQRLYVIGRKKIDFKIRREDYPELSDDDFRRYKKFQDEQKRLADALEVVSIPTIGAVFAAMGKNVDVYLTSSNDDIAGGLDIAVDFKNSDGTPMNFPDGKPMRLAIDVTYARMWNKVEKDLDRGRISKEAYEILRGTSEEVPEQLSNARAMKLFRTVVETLGGNMSTQTFDKQGPLKEQQSHVPRLIVGLDWENAFSSIANWVTQGEGFEENLKSSLLVRTISNSIKTQLVGLRELASRSPDNPNIPYLDILVTQLDAHAAAKGSTMPDDSLDNIDTLLSTLSGPTKAWQRKRLYDAALAQIEHDKSHGGHVRGDS